MNTIDIAVPILGMFVCPNCYNLLVQEDRKYVLLDEDYPTHLHKMNALIEEAEHQGMIIVYAYCKVCPDVVADRQILINAIVRKHLR